MLGKIKLSNVDDYILPQNECIKPLKSKKGSKEVQQIATISLQDCLACSGCITSAESILLEKQSYKVLLQNIEKSVISISPQARISLAEYFNISDYDCSIKLIKMFNGLGIKYVFDMQTSIDYTVFQAIQEFKQKKNIQLIISSECPGWTCFAEKYQSDFLIPFMSQIKSAMQTQGLICKQIFKDCFHTSIQPCYDKKIESFRGNEVDLILSTREIIEFIQEQKIEFNSIDINIDQDILKQNFNQILQQYFNIQCDIQNNCINSNNENITSNSYLENIMNQIVQEEDLEIQIKNGKNQDIVEYTLFKNQIQKYKFAKIYGFKNIQNLIRQLKKNPNLYNYIEIMACPMGCLNGGGQAKSLNLKPRELTIKLQEKLIQDKFLRPSLNNSLSNQLNIDNKAQFKWVEPDQNLIRW